MTVDMELSLNAHRNEKYELHTKTNEQLKLAWYPMRFLHTPGTRLAQN